jgi:aminocarboxymuconate-semialdehyde decarboxylase
MIFGGVLEKFPKLRLAFAHGGGSFPLTIGRIEHGFNVRPDLVAIDNPINPRDYIGKFWIDSLVHDNKAMAFLLDVMGEDFICMGSDYPFPLGEHRPGALIESMELSKELKEKSDRVQSTASALPPQTFFSIPDKTLLPASHLGIVT